VRKTTSPGLTDQAARASRSCVAQRTDTGREASHPVRLRSQQPIDTLHEVPGASLDELARLRAVPASPSEGPDPAPALNGERFVSGA